MVFVTYRFPVKLSGKFAVKVSRRLRCGGGERRGGGDSWEKKDDENHDTAALCGRR